MAESTNSQVSTALKKLRIKLFSLKNATEEQRNKVRDHIQAIQAIHEDIKELEGDFLDLQKTDPSFSAALLGPEMHTLHASALESAQKTLAEAKEKLTTLTSKARRRRTRKTRRSY